MEVFNFRLQFFLPAIVALALFLAPTINAQSPAPAPPPTSDGTIYASHLLFLCLDFFFLGCSNVWSKFVGDAIFPYRDGCWPRDCLCANACGSAAYLPHSLKPLETEADLNLRFCTLFMLFFLFSFLFICSSCNLFPMKFFFVFLYSWFSLSNYRANCLIY